MEVRAAMTLCLNSFLSLFLLSRLRYEEDCALSAEERREEDEERLVKNWPTFLHNLLIDPLLLRLDPDTRSEPLLEALFGTTPEDVEAPRFSPKLPEPPLAPSAPLPLSGVSTPVKLRQPSMDALFLRYKASVVAKGREKLLLFSFLDVLLYTAGTACDRKRDCKGPACERVTRSRSLQGWEVPATDSRTKPRGRTRLGRLLRLDRGSILGLPRECHEAQGMS